MNAWLAKALDRWTIHFACRFNRETDTDAPVPVRGDVPALLDGLCVEPIESPADWTWGPQGTFHFTSPIYTGADRNDTVYGRFYPAAEKWKSCPTAVLLHGWNAELCYRYQFPWLARRLGRAGLNTATIELPYHMQRRPLSGPVTDFISSDLGSMLEATRQAVADTRALCRWFEGQGSVALGLWGFSLGAWLAGLALRSESRLRFAVLTTPIARIDRVIDELAFCAPIRSGLLAQPVELERLNLAWASPLLDPHRILLVQSRYDLFAPAETVEELEKAWRQPNLWRLPHGHISVLLSAAVMKRTVGWIREQAS